MSKLNSNKIDENNNSEDNFFESEEYLQLLKEFEEHENRKKQFKNINISSKEEALEFLKSINDGEELSWAYMYSITDELKADKDIFKYIKDKFLFTEDHLYRVHCSGVVETYGSACGKCNNHEIIRQALNEVVNFLPDYSRIAYWIFHALNAECTIPFETYLNIYKLFGHNITIQGDLLNHYSRDPKREKFDYEMIRLLDASSDECIRENWYMAVNYKFFSPSLYAVLQRRNVSKEKLDKLDKEYVDYQREKRHKEIKEQEEKEKCLRKEKRKQWWNKWKR